MAKSGTGRLLHGLGWLVAAAAIFGAAYLALPYVALYRLDRALESGDVQTLDALIDWPSVRAHLRDGVLARTAAALPEGGEGRLGAEVASAFGSSLLQDVGRRLLTSRMLETAYRERRRDGEPSLLHSLDSAAFASPARFEVVVDGRRDGMRLRVQMTLEGAVWRVTEIGG